MSFVLRMPSDLVAVEAGATVPVSVEVANKNGESERFELLVEGLDPEWSAVPMPEFPVEPGETASERLFLKPPRVSESVAGNYPFVVKVRSLITGETKAVQGLLQVKPYHHISIEISPKRAHVSPTHKQGHFGVTLMNLGNTEHTLRLVGSDQDQSCAFEFDQDQVTLGPGQQRTIDMAASASSRRFMASAMLHAVTVTARSIESPSVSATAQAQLEQRATLSPGSLGVSILVLIMLTFWLLLFPKPPAIHLSVERQDYILGEQVVVSWSAQGSTLVHIQAGPQILVNDASPVGTVRFTPKQTGVITIEAYAMRDSRESRHESIQLNVAEPPPVSDPVILTLKAPATVKVGQPFIIEYAFNGATRAYLSPTGEEIDLNVNEKQLLRDTPGDFSYTLVVQGAEGRVAKKLFKVKAIEESSATIVLFTASRSTVEPAVGQVTLNWQVSGAVSLTLNDGLQTLTLDPAATSMDYSVSKTTTFTLTAYDDKGRTVSKAVKVEVSDVAKPPAENPTAPPSATSPGGR